MKPITPAEAKKSMAIPDFVIQAINDLIKKNYRGSSFTLTQDEIVDKILGSKTGISSSQIFDEHWLDFEELYRDAGWKVEYDKPAYNETYPATFKFTPRSKKPQ